MPPPLFPTITGVILDGGKATRFGGAHKAFLEVDGRTIAHRTTDLFRELFADVIAATSHPEAWRALGVTTVADPVEGAGPLAGLAAALPACATRLAFVAAGDMPWLDRATIVGVCEKAGYANGTVIPVVDGRPEPLHAVYVASLGPAALESIARGTRKLTAFLEEAYADDPSVITWMTIPGSPRSFRNVNSPADLRS